MTYGKKSWEGWVIEEEEGIAQIKEAFAAGINVQSFHAVPHL
ncbi:13632_t:CDS:1, partial [Acaulospora colombiana]